mmetsp:Transcript_9323/g.29750  ORF Transcript_9323/g.29750 Transcript_9323/m.29750 type:complete len:476 (+) Transcript_9323:68-1495(+)
MAANGPASDAAPATQPAAGAASAHEADEPQPVSETGPAASAAGGAVDATTPAAPAADEMHLDDRVEVNEDEDHDASEAEEEPGQDENAAQRNTTVLLAARPAPGKPVTLEHFQVVQTGPEQEAPLPNGSIRIQLLCVSVDPYMRCRFNASTGADYMGPFQPGAPICSGGAARVLESKTDKFAAGDLVVSQMHLPWASKQVLNPATVPDLDKIPDDIDPLLSCGPLGMAGLSAYHGVEQSKPEAGQVCVLSSCAGGVGSVAGQLFRAKGLKVIGICGSIAKCEWTINQGAADIALCYRDEDFVQQLNEHCKAHLPELYFDNVGGHVSEAVIRELAPRARIVVCGQISSYDQDTTRDDYEYPDPLPADVAEIVKARDISRERFFVGWYTKQHGEALRNMQAMVDSGKLKVPVSWVDGLAFAPTAFIALMRGGHSGKALVKCLTTDSTPSWSSSAAESDPPSKRQKVSEAESATGEPE